MSCFDDKRYMLEDGIYTLSFAGWSKQPQTIGMKSGNRKDGQCNTEVGQVGMVKYFDDK